jgi:hypothetical protein
LVDINRITNNNSINSNHSNSLSVGHNQTNNSSLKSNVPHRVDRINSAGLALNFQKIKNDFVIVNTAASMRVLNILRHWVTKHGHVKFLIEINLKVEIKGEKYFHFFLKDFSQNIKLKDETINLVYDMLVDPHLTDTEKKVARGIIQQLNILNEKTAEKSVNIEILLMPPTVAGKVKFNDLSVSEIAEQMTYIDYQIFCSISSQ